MDDSFPEGEPLAHQEEIENEETQAAAREQLTPGLTSFLTSDQLLRHLVGFVNEQHVDPDQPCSSRQLQPDPAHSIFAHQLSVGPAGAVTQQGAIGPALHSDATKSGVASARTQPTSAQQAAARPGVPPTSLEIQCAAFFRSLQAAQQSWTQQAAPTAAVNNLSNISELSLPADQRRAAPRMNADDSWKVPSFKDLLECAWKSPDSMNRRRYVALARIVRQLDAFRLASLDTEVPATTRRMYNEILRGLHREMDLIRIAESHDAGWGIVREMENQPETNDPDLQKSLARVEGHLKRKQKESVGHATKAPFRGRGGGGAALRNAQAPYPQLHWPTGALPQYSALGLQYVIRLSSYGPPAPYITAFPRLQSPGLSCFLCSDKSHFQKNCPQKPKDGAK